MSADLQPMAVVAREPGDYAPAAGAAAIERLVDAAEPLRGARILHVSPAAGGAGVPALLASLLPLAAGLGLRVEWRVLFGGDDLREASAALHDGLQGAESALELPEPWAAYLDACEQAAAAIGDGFDAVVLHDPGVLGLAATLEGPLLWRCHVDASAPDPPALERAAALIGRCAGLVFSDRSFAPEQIQGDRLHTAAPGIDPLAPLNLEPQPRLAGRLLRPLGIDLSRPLCAQVMRLDRWKDPHSTIEAFELAKAALPDLQLALAGSLDAAAEEEWRAAKEISDYAAGRADVHLLTSYESVGELELGALQRIARVVLQRSLREGFGLGASEALWKGTPVVGGREGGIPLQLRHGVDGYLADDEQDTAERVVELVRDPGLAVEMGRAGRERVRERFLVTRALEDELRALAATLERA